MTHIRQVLQLLRDHYLVVKQFKCVFCEDLIGYLGHIISAKRVAVDPDKIQAITHWPPVTTVKEVCNFSGLAGIIVISFTTML